MEEFPSTPLPPMQSPPKPPKQQVRGQRHLRKQGLEFIEAKYFSSPGTNSLAPEVTCVYPCKPHPKPKGKSHTNWKMRDSFCQLSQ